MNNDSYTGVQKAAILLITLGPEKAATIFKHLKEDEIEELTLEIANTRSVSPQTKEEVLETSDLVLGKPCRTSDEQFIYACSLGLGALDITVAYALYQNAVKLGLGTKVKLWDKPLWE